jgi:hypothetical protein
MKYTNEQIQRYESLQAESKRIEKELAEMRAAFIASQGGESPDYVVTLKDNFRETVAAKADFAAKLGPTFLKDNGLLKLTAYNTVIVTKKSRSAA